MPLCCTMIKGNRHSTLCEILFSIILVSQCAHGQTKHWSIDDTKRSTISNLLQTSKLPSTAGAVVGIARRGHLEFFRAFGSASRDKPSLITPQSVFYVASNAKQFTATAISILAQREKLQLEDDIRKWLPEFPTVSPAITIRDLIHHTSGIRDYGQLRFMRGETFHQHFDNRATIALLARQQGVNFPAASRFAYCNSNYVVLAEIVERVSGQSLKDFSTRHIFSPLAMSNTQWMAAAPIREESASFVFAESGEPRRVPVRFDGYGDGNLWTTVPDIARWDGAFYRQDSLGAATRALLQQGKLADGQSIAYGFGLVRGEHLGLTTWSHGGALFGYRSSILRIPACEMCVVVLSNASSIDAESLSLKIADIAIGLPPSSEVKESNVPSSPPGDIRRHKSELETLGPKASRKASWPHRYAGRFYSNELDTYWDISIEEGNLTTERCGYKLIFAMEEDYRFHHALFDLVFHDRKAVGGQGEHHGHTRQDAFTVHSPTASGIRFERVAARKSPG